ncbi:MAG: hypothetical protein ACP5N9_04145 [Candidatus Bilamarchaeum sp.]|jgi:hypothetical protein
MRKVLAFQDTDQTNRAGRRAAAKAAKRSGVNPKPPPVALNLPPNRFKKAKLAG